MKIFTIGFTKKSAEQFFNSLQTAGVKRVVDVRRSAISCNSVHLSHKG